MAYQMLDVEKAWKENQEVFVGTGIFGESKPELLGVKHKCYLCVMRPHPHPLLRLFVVMMHELSVQA